MKKQGSNALPKIGLTGLEAKKILSVTKGKAADHDQKKTLSGLSLQDREKDQHTALAPVVPTLPYDPRQTTLVPILSSQGLQIMVQSQEVEAKHDAKRAELEKKERRPTSPAPVALGAATSSMWSSRVEENLEVLEEDDLIRRTKKPRTASSKSS
ncbi:Uncharacterized protein Fot_24378 [Forsythia ovata]|uniref:Uncharacterized protein n=1 Tax=Forsythia ovata TaxID=205694 RepID=A0ABD1U608_9LAMI